MGVAGGSESTARTPSPAVGGEAPELNAGRSREGGGRDMHLWVSLPERRVMLSCGGEAVKVKGTHVKTSHRPHRHHRGLSCRSLLFAAVALGVILLPFLFTRASFPSLDGAAICCSINGLRWMLGPGILGRGNSRELMNKLKLVFLEMDGVDMEMKLVETAPKSYSDLVADMSSHPHQDIKTFALKTKAMLLKMHRKVQLAGLQASVFRHLASIDIPKSMHCLTLRLAEEYYNNALARSPLPPTEFVSRLNNHSFIHLALLTDNVLAAAVVASSTVKSSTNPKNIVFHVVTDKKTYASMHSWFALNPVFPAVVEVKGLHQFDWPNHVTTNILETVEVHKKTWEHSYHSISDKKYERLEALGPSSQSLLNYLKIHLPDLFPELDKVIFVHDDVVVCRDLSPLWYLDLKGKVNGAVRTAEGKGDYCVGKTFGDYLNFSSAVVSVHFDRDQCAWVDGMNIFDLKAWRRTNITTTYQHWLKLNYESGFMLWHPGSLPPALMAFEGHTNSIHPSWHLWGLGHQLPADESIQSSAVLHFSGPAKPWLEIGFPMLRNLWHAHVNYSNEFVESCRGIE
uniref:Hexosyltransferase n=1 Tax=Anthurium amnicola TaxID=1678845 RepID=A0A1D1YYC0_9ARAE